MHLIVAAFLTIFIAIESRLPSAWIFILCLLCGMFFVSIHRSLIGKAEDAPIGISVLVVVLAATIGIMAPKLFVVLMQGSLLFVAGTLIRLSLGGGLGDHHKHA